MTGRTSSATRRPRRRAVVRWLLRGVVLVAVLVIGASGAGWMLLRASLPDLDGEVPVAGLGASVTIDRDASGIPTIRAASWLDAVRGQGFVHAQDRFFQMDLTRRALAGELSELLGEATITSDMQQRVFRFRARAEDRLAALPEGHRAMLAAYAEGVNAGLAALGSRPPEYWLLRAMPRDWEPVDTLLVNDAFHMMLSFNRRYEKPAGIMRSSLPAELCDLLLPNATRWDVPVATGQTNDPTGGYTPAAIPGPDIVDLREGPGVLRSRDLVRTFGDRASIGSNAWAISGERTEDGRAILAGDPHLAMRAPGVWYRIAIDWDADGHRRFACGVSTPGSPGIIIGATDDLAWTFTNSYADQEDLVLVERNPQDRTQYRTPDGWLPFEDHLERIDVANGQPRFLTVHETQWGPIIETTRSGEPLAYCSAGLQNTVNLNLLDLAHATTLEDGLEIAATWYGPSQNVMIADAQGRIGWTISGWFPRRVGHDGTTPQPWGGGAAQWVGPIDEVSRPRVINPPGGIILTANSRPMPVPDADAFGQSWAAPWRAHRISEMLNAEPDGMFAEADLFAMQMDTHSRAHEITRAIVLEVIAADDAEPDALRARQMVEQWNGTADVDQPAFRILCAIHQQLREWIIGSLLVPCADADPSFVYNWPAVDEPLMRILEERPTHLLPPPHGHWHEYLRACVLDVIDRIADSPRGLDTPWGAFTQRTIEHPVLSRAPLVGERWNMPVVTLPGHATTVNMFTPGVGVSMRMVVSPGRWDDAILHMPCGQSGHPLSPHYADMHKPWAAGTPSPMKPGAAEHTLTLVPQ